MNDYMANKGKSEGTLIGTEMKKKKASPGALGQEEGSKTT